MLGELNVRTYVLVNFVTPSRRTEILRTSITPCSTMPSLIYHRLGWTANDTLGL